MTNRMAAPLLIAAGLLMMQGCVERKKSTGEKVEDAIQSAGDKVGDAAGKAVDKTEDAAAKAKEKVKKAVD